MTNFHEKAQILVATNSSSKNEDNDTEKKSKNVKDNQEIASIAGQAKLKSNFFQKQPISNNNSDNKINNLIQPQQQEPNKLESSPVGFHNESQPVGDELIKDFFEEMKELCEIKELFIDLPFCQNESRETSLAATLLNCNNNAKGQLNVLPDMSLLNFYEEKLIKRADIDLKIKKEWFQKIQHMKKIVDQANPINKTNDYNKNNFSSKKDYFCSPSKSITMSNQKTKKKQEKQEISHHEQIPVHKSSSEGISLKNNEIRNTTTGNPIIPQAKLYGSRTGTTTNLVTNSPYARTAETSGKERVEKHISRSSAASKCNARRTNKKRPQISNYQKFDDAVNEFLNHGPIGPGFNEKSLRKDQQEHLQESKLLLNANNSKNEFIEFNESFMAVDNNSKPTLKFSATVFDKTQVWKVKKKKNVTKIIGQVTIEEKIAANKRMRYTQNINQINNNNIDPVRNQPNLKQGKSDSNKGDHNPNNNQQQTQKKNIVSDRLFAKLDQQGSENLEAKSIAKYNNDNFDTKITNVFSNELEVVDKLSQKYSCRISKKNTSCMADDFVMNSYHNNNKIMKSNDVEQPNDTESTFYNGTVNFKNNKNTKKGSDLEVMENNSFVKRNLCNINVPSNLIPDQNNVDLDKDKQHLNNKYLVNAGMYGNKKYKDVHLEKNYDRGKIQHKLMKRIESNIY